MNRHNKVKLVASLRGKHDVQVRHLCRPPTVHTHLIEPSGARTGSGSASTWTCPKLPSSGAPTRGSRALSTTSLPKRSLVRCWVCDEMCSSASGS